MECGVNSLHNYTWSERAVPCVIPGCHHLSDPSDTTRDRTFTTRTVVRSIHRTYLTCGEKNWKNKLSLFVPLSPLCSTLLPLGQNYLFFYKKKILGVRKICAVLVKGLPYIRNRTGDKWSLENYSHGRESRGEGWHKNLPALWIQILLETHPLPGAPGAYGDFEAGATVQTISRGRWALFTGREGAEGETHMPSRKAR